MSGNHNDILNAYAVVSVQTACAIIGGDGEPVSRTTLDRMIRDGALVASGSGRLRRVTTESIRQYLSGERTWQRSGAKRAAAHSGKTSTGSGGPKRPATGERSAPVLLVGRKPGQKPKR